MGNFGTEKLSAGVMIPWEKFSVAVDSLGLRKISIL